jgi:CRP-like cAMP-binding protein
MDKKTYQKDAHIFREGGNPGEVYLVLEGEVNITKESGGKNVLVATLRQNDVFGEMALIDSKPRSASAVVQTEEATCLVLTVSEFKEKLEAMDPFMRGIFRVMVGRMRDETKKALKHGAQADYVLSKLEKKEALLKQKEEEEKERKKKDSSF